MSGKPSLDLFASRAPRQVRRPIDESDHAVVAHGALPHSGKAPRGRKHYIGSGGLLQLGKATRKYRVDADQSTPSLDSLGAVQNAVNVEEDDFHPTWKAVRNGRIGVLPNWCDPRGPLPACRPYV